MNRLRITLATAAALALLTGVGCAHKKVATTTPPPPPPPVAAAPAPAATPAPAQARPQSTAATPPAPTLQDLFNRSIHDVYFDFDKYAIRTDQESAAEAAARFLAAHPGVQVTIEGHCDDRGSEEYNLALGDSRANALRSKLVTSGAQSTQLKTISYGKEKPFCTADNEQCWQQNRRDHYVLAAH